MMLRLKLILFAVLGFVACNIGSANSQSKIAGELAKRILGDKCNVFEFIEIPDAKNKKSPDVFTLESKNGKIIIGGNNVNSMAVGLNYYLNNYAGTTVSWYKDDAVFIPESFPTLENKIEVKSIVPNRFFLNYCTFGYTMTGGNGVTGSG